MLPRRRTENSERPPRTDGPVVPAEKATGGAGARQDAAIGVIFDAGDAETPERPTCHPSAGLGYQSTSNPNTEELASALDEAARDFPSEVTFSPTKGPPLKVAETLAICTVPARTKPLKRLPPMATEEFEHQAGDGRRSLRTGAGHFHVTNPAGEPQVESASSPAARAIRGAHPQGHGRGWRGRRGRAGRRSSRPCGRGLSRGSWPCCRRLRRQGRWGQILHRIGGGGGLRGWLFLGCRCLRDGQREVSNRQTVKVDRT